MQVCDFSRSFFTIRIDRNSKSAQTMSKDEPWTVNNARFPVECRCILTDGDRQVEYLLGASCKSEWVNVDSGVWDSPNADMCMIQSEEDFLVIKSWDHRGRRIPLHPPTLGDQPLRQSGKNADAFDRVDRSVRMTEGQVLKTTDQVIEAGLGNRPLVSQTCFSLDDGKKVVLEYPVKDCNFSDYDHYYQVDTGPVLMPDPSRNGEPWIENLELAFIAHSKPDWAEFIVNVPTPLAGGISVDHYSESRRIDNTENMMFAVD